MKVRVMIMSMIVILVVAVNDTNMLVNYWLITQFKSNCTLLRDISFEILSDNNILLCEKKEKSHFLPPLNICFVYYTHPNFKKE
jgi:hypothetical protein